MQNYNRLGSSATNGYELCSILHHKKNETQLSKKSIVMWHLLQKY